MVAQVGRHVGVHARRPDRREQVVARSPADRHRAHRPVRVAADPHPAAVAGSAAATCSAKSARVPPAAQRADPAEAAGAGQGHQLDQVEGRLLVGVGCSQRRHHGRTPVPGEHHLDPRLGHPLALAAPGRSRGRAPASGVNVPVPAEVNAHRS